MDICISLTEIVKQKKEIVPTGGEDTINMDEDIETLLCMWAQIW
jgi:hypothetical protein